jgi:HlyD family secretion protein
VKKEEFGTVLGTVQSVSDLPVSNAAIKAMLHNDGLVQQFTREGSPILVRAHLMKDPSTPSRLAWTSGRGPDFDIEPGTLVSATITVREQAPVTLILPFLKSILGLGA